MNKELYIAFFMLQKFKHLHCLTFAISSLNKQLKAPTLISINKVHFVSYCSTVMLYVTFFFSCVILNAPPSDCGQSSYRFSLQVEGESTTNWTLSI